MPKGTVRTQRVGAAAERNATAAIIARGTIVACLLIACILAIGIMGGRVDAQSGITSPAAGSTISGDVPVMGTAQIDPFQKYELYFKLEPSSDDAYVYFDGNTSPVTNGQLGVWHAAGLEPGTYTLRLRVVKADGNYAEYFSPNLNVNQGAAAAPTGATATITPTSSVPTATFTPAPSATPVIGAVEQPQLDGTPTAPPAPLGADANAQPTAPAPGSTVQAGDLSAQQSSSAVAAAEPTPASASARALGEALSMDRLRLAFYRGIRLSAAVFLIVAAVLGGKWLFTWARRRYG